MTPMEDYLKISKVEHLSNYVLDPSQIFKWRQPLMEEDLKVLKVEYLSNHLLDHTHILN